MYMLVSNFWIFGKYVRLRDDVGRGADADLRSISGIRDYWQMSAAVGYCRNPA